VAIIDWKWRSYCAQTETSYSGGSEAINHQTMLKNTKSDDNKLHRSDDEFYFCSLVCVIEQDN